MKKILSLALGLLFIAVAAFAAGQTEVNDENDTFELAWDRQQVMNTEIFTFLNNNIIGTDTQAWSAFLDSIDQDLGTTDSPTFAGATFTASPTPINTFNDSDDAVGSSSNFSNSSGGANDIIATHGVEDSTGENTPYFKMNGVNEANEFVKVIDPQAGTNGKTLLGDPDTWDITPALHKGGSMTANAAGADELDLVEIGMELSVDVDDAIIVTITPNSADTIWQNGVALAQGEGLVSDNTAGAVSSMVCEHRAANAWKCITTGFTEVTP